MLCFFCKALAFLLCLALATASPVALPENSSNDFGMMIENLQVNVFYFTYRKSWDANDRFITGSWDYHRRQIH